VLQYGYMDLINIEETLSKYLLSESAAWVENQHICFYFSKESAKVSDKHNILVRLLLSGYCLLLRNAYFLQDEVGLNENKTLGLGIYITI